VKSLTSVGVKACSNLTDESIKALAASCCLLKLDVESCAELTDEAIKAVALGCGASLKSLDFGDCPNLTDESMTAVALGCTSLTWLNLARCAGISYKTRPAVKFALPALASVTIMVG
jgi:hypothetical protein